MFKAYCVTVPPEDLVHFATLQPAICFVYALIDDMMAERDARMERFISSLATDQSKIKEEVTKLACVLEVQYKEIRKLYLFLLLILYIRNKMHIEMTNIEIYTTLNHHTYIIIQVNEG